MEKMPPPQNNASKDPVSKKPPMALFIWIIIFMFLGTLLIFKFSPIDQYEKWDASEFEKNLLAGNVITAEITPETNRILTIKGKYRSALTNTQAFPARTDKKQKKMDSSEGKYTATEMFSESLINMLKEKQLEASGVQVTIHNRETWWQSLVLTILPIIIIVGLLYFLFSRQIKMAGKGAMQFGKSKARMIMPDDNKITFDDIAGADEAKEETKEIVDYLKDPLKYKMLGGKIPKGALLIGPPGTGKTLMAKAVTGEANVPFFSISGSDFVEMFVGVGASRVRDMFEQARRHSPCLIFIDEIDAVGRSRFSGIGGGHDEREQTLNALLVEMDGLETQEGVIILAATNRADVLDPALTRPGRFDRQIVLDLPDIKGRRQILDVHIKSIKVDEKINLNRIAKSTPGFSGADLANLVNEAALHAARNDRSAATIADFEEARDKVKWGRERKSRKISERERKLTAYHEAGHTLVALMSPDAMPLHKVTIIPRGQAYLGATMQLPTEDRYTQSKNELLDLIKVLMGGKEAEFLTFNDTTSGASNDIKEATRAARAMVCSFGMSEKMGPVQYGQRAEHIFIGKDITREEPYGEETAREIDLEVKKIIEECRDAARNILTENRDQLIKLSEELLEKETLDVKEIKKLLGMPPDEEQEEDYLDLEEDSKSSETSDKEKSEEKKEGSGESGASLNVTA